MLIRGVETCDVMPGPLSSPDPEGTMRGRGGTLQCTDVANDPRVSGSVSGTFDADAWGSDTDAFVMWGTLRLENDGGSWEGRYTGANTTETGDMYEVWYTGTGAYAGLSYFQWVSSTAACAPVQDRLEFVGLIFPGPPPTP